MQRRMAERNTGHWLLPSAFSEGPTEMSRVSFKEAACQRAFSRLLCVQSALDRSHPGDVFYVLCFSPGHISYYLNDLILLQKLPRIHFSSSAQQSQATSFSTNEPTFRLNHCALLMLIQVHRPSFLYSEGPLKLKFKLRVQCDVPNNLPALCHFQGHLEHKPPGMALFAMCLGEGESQLAPPSCILSVPLPPSETFQVQKTNCLACGSACSLPTRHVTPHLIFLPLCLCGHSWEARQRAGKRKENSLLT